MTNITEEEWENYKKRVTRIESERARRREKEEARRLSKEKTRKSKEEERKELKDTFKRLPQGAQNYLKNRKRTNKQKAGQEVNKGNQREWHQLHKEEKEEFKRRHQSPRPGENYSQYYQRMEDRKRRIEVKRKRINNNEFE
uniref:Cir_N domain-containing protein n=1 Tax=Strongyloides papillosus TaxID=174720 RepID=A0A0N5BRN0_STREA